jgi:hypothetical protein
MENANVFSFNSSDFAVRFLLPDLFWYGFNNKFEIEKVYEIFTQF